MDAKERREELLRILQQDRKPVVGSQLAAILGVSRQVIVGDIAILRASGIDIIATPQGYMLPTSYQRAIVETIACKHGKANLANELEVIVDHGGKIIDVIVEHPLYGDIRANLMLETRHDVVEFLKNLENCGAEPLSIVTGGVHLHTIEVRSEDDLSRIQQELLKRGILLK